MTLLIVVVELGSIRLFVGMSAPIRNNYDNHFKQFVMDKARWTTETINEYTPVPFPSMSSMLEQL